MADFDPFDRPLARAARLDDGERTAACLDAATLAAWTDGTLRPAERAAAEAHTADCGRCLALLAAMARTEPPPAVPASTAWLPMRWLVPLASAAVAIAAWVIIRDPAMVPPPALQEMASAPAPPAASAATPPSEAAKQEAPTARRERVQQRDTRETKAAERAPAAGLADSAAPKSQSDALARGAATPQPVPPLPPPVPAAPSFKAEASSEHVVRRQADATTSRVVLSPDPAVLWRLSGRSIAQTRDGGKTWITQLTATADLLAGTSPTSGTCWVVGRSGLVLRSSDGQTWQTTASPAPGIDLVAVSAPGPLAATVTTIDGRTYRTSDGGRTWTLQEVPAAPF